MAFCSSCHELILSISIWIFPVHVFLFFSLHINYFPASWKIEIMERNETCFSLQEFILLHLKKMDQGDRETPEVTDELYNVCFFFYANLLGYLQTQPLPALLAVVIKRGSYIYDR